VTAFVSGIPDPLAAFSNAVGLSQFFTAAVIVAIVAPTRGLSTAARP
jgi:hypothetical protein